MKVFLAGPFFNEEERNRVREIAEILQDIKGLEVFIPMKNQFKPLEFGEERWRKAVFSNDVIHILESDVMIAIHDSGDKPYPDSGTMWEMGFAYANRIPIIVYTEKDTVMNLMIAESGRAYVHSLEDLIAYDFNTLPSNTYNGKII
ncbi:nucleoside 2-deoxyribosyltransferase [Pontibacillus chungwhensis BH030062]|uniref:Nucleoside 2-deoxyribosyltransferase n=1 Tax=Pontibacillus chungwhensis BH030062 TaxID=1385513 RepID=A0A0A2VHY5_9BACI|nr:nucleoside 2-deoxyribosyltransferase [Pontibacillus chungwhensis]KGP93230.1 nucleoside 2-deoxyribosyltransferase [Pontibacillus chungwhensis BH030062]